MQNPPTQGVATTELYGAPSKYLNTDGSTIAFNCQSRLCILDSARAVPVIKLVSSDQNTDGIDSAWVTIDRVRYLIASYKGQLTAFRP